jgi:microcystin-dependent protein
MATPFLAEIRMFAGNYAPAGWALCNGQILPIQQNTALFSLMGTFYGGNGTTNFALPNLQGNAPMHRGQGIGLSQRVIGEIGGSETVTLLQTEMPFHTHTAQVSTGTDHLASPVGNAWGSGQRGMSNVYAPSSPGNNVQMNPFSTSISGGNLPHNNMPPYLVVTFIIAMVGVFPARN